METLIRPARRDDIEGMIDLLAGLFSIESDFACDPAKHAAGLGLLLESEAACVLVAERDGRPVGMVSAQTVISTAEGGPVGWVEDLVVAEACRSAGLGRRLLAALEDWALRRGLTRLQLLADRDNHPALDFYRHLGWGETALIALRKFPG